MASIKVDKFTLTPKTSVTDLVEELHISSEPNELRREMAAKPAYYKDAQSIEGLPVYYIKETPDPEKDDWTAHAIDTDILKYLLRKND